MTSATVRYSHGIRPIHLAGDASGIAALSRPNLQRAVVWFSLGTFRLSGDERVQEPSVT